jgi:glycerol-3-phosphate O-acyltransferase/dihydroxyacetone phosphate acyltransferase
VPGLAGEHLDGEGGGTDGRDSVLSALHLVYMIVHLLLLLALAAVPVLLLNLPVGLVAGLYSESRRKKALAASKVKIRGYDVSLRSWWRASSRTLPGSTRNLTPPRALSLL